MLRTTSRLLRPVGALLFTAFCAASADAQAQVPMTTTRVASGLARPLYVTAPAGDTSRLFILEQFSGTTGRVRILNLPGNTLNATPYLSISPLATGNEQGLLGLAFHPDFANNGFFYVHYNPAGGASVIARYTANAPFMTSTTADAASATIVLQLAQPFSNHNGGWIGFGPDGYLYAAFGDGGSANDPGNRAQTITNQLLGKMLRLDVDGPDAYPADALRNYAIPPTNPFVGIAGDDEIWHYGLRNPWRNSFDRQTGALYIGDVGQNAVEEISYAPAGLGGLNYGWRCTEGTTCTGLTGCTCNGPTLTPPIHTNTHAAGNCSITGGYVYRGSALCGVQGTYFFADYCANQIWSFRYNGATVSQFTTRTAELAPGGGLAINSITSFGEDANGELYICDQGGEIFKIIPRPVITTDCNGNGAWDACDIQNGTSLDANANTVPDECEFSIGRYCPGDGTGQQCPCANNGQFGNGCANSSFALGGSLDGSGTARISNDTVLLDAGNLTGASAVFFQGASQVTPTVIDDGIGCVGGPIVRLGTVAVGGGFAVYPDVGNLPVSVRGGIAVPGTFHYQCFYRNAAAAFCPPATSNRTNGLVIVWAP